LKIFISFGSEIGSVPRFLTVADNVLLKERLHEEPGASMLVTVISGIPTNVLQGRNFGIILPISMILLCPIKKNDESVITAEQLHYW
jgi:hypothetical protein